MTSNEWLGERRKKNPRLQKMVEIEMSDENHQGETMMRLHSFERENFGEERKKMIRAATIVTTISREPPSQLFLIENSYAG